MLCLLRNSKTFSTFSSTTSHLTSTILKCSDIAFDLSVVSGLPLISTLLLGSYKMYKDISRINWYNNNNNNNNNKAFKSQTSWGRLELKCSSCISRKCTLQNSWRVSFSKTGECSRIHVSELNSPGIHQYSLSDRVFKLVNMGQHFKSLLNIDCKHE